jgi:hypothetical protein
MPGKPMKSRPSSERAPTGSGCRSRGPPPEASSDVARGPVRLPAGLSAPLRGSWKILLPARCQPARSGRTFLRMRRKSPRPVRGPVQSRLRPCAPGHAGGATSKRRAALRPAQAGARGRPASLRPAYPASSTILMAHGERRPALHAGPRGARWNLRSRRLSGSWGQRAAPFALAVAGTHSVPMPSWGGCRGGE